MIKNCLIDCEKTRKLKIIGIEGFSGAGKTILANILNATGSNTELIDARSLIGNFGGKATLSPVKGSTKAYIIDEAGLIKAKSLISTIKEITRFRINVDSGLMKK